MEVSGVAPGEALAAHLLGGDAIASDDVAPVLVAPAGAIAVVAEAADETAVTGGPPVVEQALAALRSDLRRDRCQPSPISAGDFTGFLGVVVDDPPGFTPEQRRALASYLEGGGVMLVALGPRAAAAPLGATLQPLLDHATTWSDVEGERRGAERGHAVLLGESARSLVNLGAAKRTTLSPADVGTIENVAAVERRRAADRAAHVGARRGVDRDAARSRSTRAISRFVRRSSRSSTRSSRRPTPTRRRGAPTSDRMWTLPSGASSATGPSGPIELVREGGRAKLVPPLAGAYHVTIDGKDELRVAAPIARETDLRPRALKSQEASSHLGATQAQIDISPHVAIALLLLLTVEMVLRVRAQRDAQPA